MTDLCVDPPLTPGIHTYFHISRKISSPQGAASYVSCVYLAVADLRGGVRDARPPLCVQILSISCSFWENLAKLRVHAPPLEGSRPPPPWGNPGSVTVLLCHLSFSSGQTGKQTFSLPPSLFMQYRIWPRELVSQVHQVGMTGYELGQILAQFHGGWWWWCGAYSSISLIFFHLFYILRRKQIINMFVKSFRPLAPSG